MKSCSDAEIGPDDCVPVNSGDHERPSHHFLNGPHVYEGFQVLFVRKICSRKTTRE